MLTSGGGPVRISGYAGILPRDEAMIQEHGRAPSGTVQIADAVSQDEQRASPPSSPKFITRGSRGPKKEGGVQERDPGGVEDRKALCNFLGRERRASACSPAGACAWTREGGIRVGVALGADDMRRDGPGVLSNATRRVWKTRSVLPCLGLGVSDLRRPHPQDRPGHGQRRGLTPLPMVRICEPAIEARATAGRKDRLRGMHRVPPLEPGRQQQARGPFLAGVGQHWPIPAERIMDGAVGFRAADAELAEPVGDAEQAIGRSWSHHSFRAQCNW